MAEGAGGAGRICLAALAGLAAWPVVALGLRNVTGPEYSPLPFFLAYLLPLGAGLPALLVAEALVPCRCRGAVTLPLLLLVNAGLPLVAWWRPALVLPSGASLVAVCLPPVLMGLAAGTLLLRALHHAPAPLGRRVVVAGTVVAVVLLWVGAKAYHATMTDRATRLLRLEAAALVQERLLAAGQVVRWHDLEIVGAGPPYTLRLPGHVEGQPGLTVLLDGLRLVPRGRPLTWAQAFAPGSPVSLRVATTAPPLPLRPSLDLPGLRVAREGPPTAVRAVVITAAP